MTAVADTTEVQLSPELKDFYEQHSVAEHLVLSSSHQDRGFRFIRCNPRFDIDETLSLLKTEILSSSATAPSSDVTSSTPVCADDSALVQHVSWLDPQYGFYAVPGTFALSSSQVFRLGRIYGMDVSSGTAVAALLSNQYNVEGGVSSEAPDPTRPVRVLDLCCCPGLKLCMMADLLQDSSTSSTSKPTATIVGVDISESRLAVCKRVVTKYHIPNHSDYNHHTQIRLYCADGTTFGTSTAKQELVFDAQVAADEMRTAGTRKRLNKSARARQRKRLAQIVSLESIKTIQRDPKNDDGSSSETNSTDDILIEPFDYVLVDAECSTDGSLKHVQQRLAKQQQQESIDTGDANTRIVSNPTLVDSNKLQELVQLQRRLLENGFRLLKPGGLLVYSTCSLSTAQNEDVVHWFLQEHTNDCTLVPVKFPLATSSNKNEDDDNEKPTTSLPGTVRFTPRCGASKDAALVGEGFFLAKLMKR